jgi:hypothetical protein
LTGRQFYLGTEDKIEPNRVYEALSYLWDKITTRHERNLKYYERVKQMLEGLLPEEERRRWKEIQALVSKLDTKEMKVLVKLSLSEEGLSPFDLERRGIPSQRILPTIRKLSELGIIEKKSETRLRAGMKKVKYTANIRGARLALEYLRKTSDGELKEDKLRQMAEGDFNSTPLGALYKQIQVVKAGGRLNN